MAKALQSVISDFICHVFIQKSEAEVQYNFNAQQVQYTWYAWIICSGVTSRGRMPPWGFSLGNFCWPTGKGKMENKKRKGGKGRWKIGNRWEKGEKYENGTEDLWGFFFFFFAFHFLKQLKFVLGLPKWKFSTGKKHFTPAGKNQGKVTLSQGLH